MGFKLFNPKVHILSIIPVCSLYCFLDSGEQITARSESLGYLPFGLTLGICLVYFIWELLVKEDRAFLEI